MIKTQELSLAIKQICEEKGIPFESVIKTIEAALAMAYRKEYGQKGQDVRAEFNPINGGYRLFDVKTVVEDELYAEWAEREKLKAESGEEALPEIKKMKEEEVPVSAEDEEKKKFYNPRTDIALAEALKIKADAKVGDEIFTELKPPVEYGRMASQTAKQVIIQKLREAERETIFSAYKDKINQAVSATIQRVDGRMVYVDLGHAVALLPPSEQSYGEVYRPGQRLKVFLLSVEKSNRGPEIVASRAHPGLVSSLFEEEVPEIQNGTIEIKGVAREAGWRTKIAVLSKDTNIDPIGSCVGQRGTRVQTVIAELGGEKIDIIEYSEDRTKFLVNALSPAKVMKVEIAENPDTGNRATVFVQNDQFSLAVGKSGQNVRLASKLVGLEVDIRKDESAEPVEPEKTEETKPEEKSETSTS